MIVDFVAAVVALALLIYLQTPFWIKQRWI